MAIPDYTFQEARWKSLLGCIVWCRCELQLRDWQVDLWDENMPNGDLGEADINILRKIAIVKIDYKKCKKENISPYSVVVHEMLHIAARSHLLDVNCDDEFLVRVLEPAYYERFCLENNKRITGKSWK